MKKRRADFYLREFEFTAMSHASRTVGKNLSYYDLPRAVVGEGVG